MRRNTAIDLLRIISCLLIILHHFQQVLEKVLTPKMLFMKNYGLLVELFFVISGFLTISKDNDSVLKYMLRKIIRLLPLVVISVVLYELLIVLYFFEGGWLWPFSLKVDIVGSFITAIGLSEWGLIYCNGINNPVWYISVLLLCYIIEYLISTIFRRWKLNPEYGYFFCIIIGLCGKIIHANYPFFTAGICRGYIAFFVGVITRKKYQRIKYKNDMKCLLCESVVLMLSSIAYMCLYNTKGINYLLFFLIYPLIVIICNNRYIIDLVEKINFGKLINALGEATYDIYILHIDILLLIMIISSEIGKEAFTIVTMLIFVILCFCIGVISNRFVSVPIKRLLNKYIISN